MVIVSNTTPLIGLAAIDRFELLFQLFGKIYIPQAVYDEAVVAGREQGGAKQAITKADWIEVVSVKERELVTSLLSELDLGEAETIILAQELNADWILMDERKGRRKVTELGLNKIGTVGLLLKAKQMGLLDVIRPDLEQLRLQGFSISQYVVDIILQEAEE
jgi:predicted nucleic acid-binding protein